MRWFLYNFLFFLLYLLLFPKLYFRMKKRGGYRAKFEERFGRYDSETARRLSEKPRLWIHAVSVGEANIAGQLIREMRRRDPSFSCILSTTSSTGRGVCEKIVGPDDVLIYLPLDIPWCVRRALETIRATALVVVETEFWPNLVRALHKKGIPLLLANGRVSDVSAPKYRALKMFFGPVLSCFDTLLAQSETDRERLLSIGAPGDRIVITGSVKFDILPPTEEKIAHAKETLACAGIVPGRDLVLLGGSTWPGEEVVLADTWNALRASFPTLRLVLCPRHFERGDEVTAALVSKGFEVIRRSKTEKPTDATDSSDAILLVDTTGELFALYSQADFVFVGRTFAPNEGGQNMIEPASFGKIVFCGPHTENFALVMETFRKNEAIVEVSDAEALKSALTRFLQDEISRKTLGDRAFRTVSSGRGALKRTVDSIEALLR